jgi:hypothetical protein
VRVKASYAVIWRNGDRPQATGRLELGREAIELEGAANGTDVHEQIPYRELASVAVGRTGQERIGGQQTLVLERRGGSALRVASVAQPWIVSELAERLAALHLDQAGGLYRLAVVVPIREGARDESRRLLRDGAPFDPEAAGLERHFVLLGDSGAVFVFEAKRAEAIERLFGSPELWAATEAWKDVAAGPPAVAETVFEWARTAQPR